MLPFKTGFISTALALAAQALALTSVPASAATIAGIAGPAPGPRSPAPASVHASSIEFVAGAKDARPVRRVVVKFRAAAVAAAAAPARSRAYGVGTPAATAAAADIAGSLSRAANGGVADAAVSTRITLRAIRASGERSVVYELERAVGRAHAADIAASLLKDPRVEVAEPDVDVRAMVLNDGPMPAGAGMWNLDRPSATNRGASDFVRAWALVPAGTARVRVAVIDTGSTAHLDLRASDVGLNFVSDRVASGDVGRGEAATDNGDYCDDAGMASSWHGLKVGSTIAAVADNRLGVAGAAAGHAQVHALRALGRCGGYLADTADAVRWAAGLAVPGMPANNTPAKVINLSLGGWAACPTFMQEAITAATVAGVTVVAAAGNDTSLSISTPANCSGVIAVTAGTRSGDLAGYSNVGGEAALMAPAGGSCRQQGPGACDATAVVALSNAGLRAPEGDVGATAVLGTSFSAPNVAAAAALLYAVNARLTPADVRSILLATARPFPAGTWCADNPGLCGSGILDAHAAVSSIAVALPPPLVAVDRGPALPQYPGNTLVTVSASASQGLAPYTYAWTQTSGPQVALATPAGPSTGFRTPATGSIRNPIVLAVAVTGADGQVTQATASVPVGNPPTVSLTVRGDKSGVHGTALRIPLTVTEPDGQAVSLSLLDAPAGLAGVVNNTTTPPTAELVWSSPVAGTYAVRILATDADGLTNGGSESFTLTVTAAGSGGGGAAPAPTPTPAPAPTPTPTPTPEAGSGAGTGGGALGLHWALLLAGAVVALWRAGLVHDEVVAMASGRSRRATLSNRPIHSLDQSQRQWIAIGNAIARLDSSDDAQH